MRVGAWYDLAQMIRSLNSKGVDTVMVEELTGIDRPEQNAWIIGAEVYNTIRDQLDATELAFFEHPERSHCLLEMRYNNVEGRAQTAKYMAQVGIYRSSSSSSSSSSTHRRIRGTR